MYDIIIIGGGPAGLTAGLYGARARLNVIMLERLSPGGQILNTDLVENYPGFPDGISGFELVDRMRSQAENFDLVIQNEEVVELELSPEKKVVATNKKRMETRAIILTCGATQKKLGIEGETLLTGRGVSYCATCDGPFYRDQEVAVIGGGDMAVEESIFLTRFVSKVYLIHRRDKLRAIKLLQDRAMGEEKIELVWDTIPLKILGKDGVEEIELKNVKSGEVTHKQLKGVFVLIGTQANSDLVKGMVELDKDGFIITDNTMGTNIPGVFAAGDVRSKSLRQVSTAVGEGAAASFSAEKYLEGFQ